jgi:RNA 3'-terminal phosphate cyclase (ATP)
MMSAEMIIIDGAAGEGGGQVLRTAIGLSMVTSKPFRIENIRGGREKPGLLRQHLTAVNAAAEISSAHVDGAAIGSRELTFAPGKVRAGTYAFSIGSAGSTTLVLQAILPALLVADRPSNLTLEGGTHNPSAPPIDFIEKAYCPTISRLGPQVHVALDRYGFYPAGGGRFFASIVPAEKMTAIELTERGANGDHVAHAVIAAVPADVAKRELELIAQQMQWPPQSLRIKQVPNDQGPGNLVMLEVAHQHVTEVFTSFGQRGIRAEAVAADAIQQAKRYLSANVPVGPCLADQLMIPFALAGGGAFVTQALTRHATTNIGVIRRFLDVTISTEQLGRDKWRVVVQRP